VIAGLVKIQTGFSQVSAPAYLKQADEIFSRGTASTEGLSHPESFIRARALALWQEEAGSAETQISEMIEGKADIEGLDVIGQVRFATATRTLLQHLLRPKWFQTPAVLAHAKFFFEDFAVDDGLSAQLPKILTSGDARLQEYLCFVLLDFVRADSDLDEMPLAAALELSRRLEMESQFEKIAAKELRIKVRDLRRIREQATETTGQSGGEP
jgi:hypothetical protein